MTNKSSKESIRARWIDPRIFVYIFVLLETLTWPPWTTVQDASSHIVPRSLLPPVPNGGDDSGGVKFAINNNDNKLSGSEYSAASLLNRVSIDESGDRDG